MIQKRYHNDWAKAKSRDLVRDVIKRTVLRFRKKQDLHVLCFPGVDAEEIFQVYDPLGIPRKNIFGVERDSDIADVLESKNLGIKVVRGSVEDYVREQPSLTFDVVSLDYIGPFGNAQIDTLTEIVKKQERDHFVLHTANLLRRDKRSIPWYSYGHAMADDRSTDELGALPLPGTYSRSIQERMIEFVDKLKSKEGIMSEKSDSYSLVLRGIYSGATIDVMDKLFRFAAGEAYEAVLRRLDQTLSKMLGRELRFDRESPFGSFQGQGFFPIVQNMLECAENDLLKFRCHEHGINDESLKFAAWMMLSDGAKERKFYRALDVERYTYISESGAPMIGDVRFISYARRMADVCQEFCHLVGYPQEFDLRPVKHEKFLKFVRQYSRATVQFADKETIQKVYEADKNRIFLGNSAKPVLTKKRAIREFEEGASIDDLKEKYRGWSNKPLAQWKAHVTMGTYSSQLVMKNGTANGNDDSNGEDKITKEEALELIVSGIPTEEIHEAFPTSFSPAQLRAYKAHVTMGTYGK